jgi:hypothetical protein
LIIFISLNTTADWLVETRDFISEVSHFEWEDVYGYGINPFSLISKGPLLKDFS